MSAEHVWAEWLDAVESAARSVEQQALVRDVPQRPAVPRSAASAPMASALPMPALPMPALPMPALPMPALPMPALPMPALPMPTVPWPPSLESRRREVLATLAAATETVERRRNEIAAALNRLAHAPSRRVAAGYADGVALDVVG